MGKPWGVLNFGPLVAVALLGMLLGACASSAPYLEDRGPVAVTTAPPSVEAGSEEEVEAPVPPPPPAKQSAKSKKKRPRSPESSE